VLPVPRTAAQLLPLLAVGLPCGMGPLWSQSAMATMVENCIEDNLGLG